MKQLRKSLKESRKLLARKAKSLPNKDAYATAYSVLVDAVEAIDIALKDIGPAIKNAKKLDKEHPSDLLNRAIDWCYKP